jgi:hypothetical protein
MVPALMSRDDKMNVVRMSDWVDRETVILLARLLEAARKGEIKGLAVCYRADDGGETAELTGHYRRCLKDGISASMSLSWTMTQLQAESSP